MAVYYLRESDGAADPDSVKRSIRRAFPWTLVGVILILAATALEAVGWPLAYPRLLRAAGISSPVTKQRRIVHLISGEGSGEIPPMDLALALRGLLKVQPSFIYVDGMIRSDTETTPLLSGILAAVRAKIPVVMPPVGADPHYRPVPLCFYDSPGGPPRHWPRLDAGFSNAGPACFFPSLPKDPSSLPLFADLSGGLAAGSLWWDLLVQDLPRESREPLWIVCSRILLIGDHVPLPLTSDGMVACSNLQPAIGIPLDDFLLELERSDRGMPASQFFSQWKNAVVLIAPRDSARPLALLEGLRELISWKRIPLSVQGAAGLMCAVILLAGRTRFLLKNRRNAALALAGATLLAWIVGLRFGVIVPLLPAGLTILFLFLQRPVRGPRERTA
jgi:hypothetical protein